MAGTTITLYGPQASAIDELATRYPTHTTHRVGVAALRIGLRTILESQDLLEAELVTMARETGCKSGRNQ